MNEHSRRFVIEISGNDHRKAAEIMLIESLRICKQMGLEQITFLVPAKESFPTTVAGTAIDGLTKSGTVKALCAGKALSINGINLRLESLKTFNEYMDYQLLVGIYLREESLDTFDSPARVAALMYLPWTEKEGRLWLSAWEATVIGQEKWQPEPLQLDESVVASLEDLTHSINLSTGLINSMDKKSALEMFASFRRKGLYPNPEDIRRWALRHGWEPRYARDLAHQAEIRLKLR